MVSPQNERVSSQVCHSAVFLTHRPLIAANRVRGPVAHTVARDGQSGLAQCAVDPPLVDFEKPGWAQMPLPLALDTAATTHELRNELSSSKEVRGRSPLTRIRTTVEKCADNRMASMQETPSAAVD